jgi:uncharacterized protein YndB with AHSA1/START domain
MGLQKEAKVEGREISLTRIFDAPRFLVFRAWTDPNLVVKWWGPTGFTNTISEMDVRPGGRWKFVVHGPDGVDYPNEIVYEEIVEPERLVYSHVVAPKFRMSIALLELGSKTELTALMVFLSAEDFESAVKQVHAVEGLKETLARLEGELASEQSGIN